MLNKKVEEAKLKYEIALNHFNNAESDYIDKAIEELNIAEKELNDAIKDSNVIVLAIPSSQIRSILSKIEPLIDSKPIILNVSKGFDVLFDSMRKLSSEPVTNLTFLNFSGFSEMIFNASLTPSQLS